jgi:hypothetical protein
MISRLVAGVKKKGRGFHAPALTQLTFAVKQQQSVASPAFREADDLVCKLQNFIAPPAKQVGLIEELRHQGVLVARKVHEEHFGFRIDLAAPEIRYP